MRERAASAPSPVSLTTLQGMTGEARKTPAAVETVSRDAPSSLALDPRTHRLRVLDGWRGISILLVMAGHMLPLGPKWLELNSMVAAAGLNIFFCLSGFLIVSMLLRNRNVISFFIRRLFRILPLAWLALLAILLVEQPESKAWYSNLLFYANLDPDTLLPHAEHLWSLSVEMQFYLAAGAVVAMLGLPGLFLVPVAGVAVTLARVIFGMESSIITWFCADQILAGGTLALFVNLSPLADTARKWPLWVPFLSLAGLFLTSHQLLGPANYFRPYVAALLIYSTIYPRNDRLHAVLSSRPLGYLAKTSYALYVVHPLSYAGWLGEGDVVIRYAKRMISFVLTFAVAHFSTAYYEKYWNELGHRLAARVEHKARRGGMF